MIRSFLILSSVWFASCAVFPEPQPADIIYRLSHSGQGVTPSVEADVIRVDRPTGLSVFNSNNIVVSPDGRRMSQAAGSRWAQPIPLMLQSSLVEALSGSPDLIGVLPSSGARTDTRIHLTIKNFEAQFDQGEKAAPIAIVRYTATLADASDRALLNTFVAHKSVRADAASVSEIVRALETANNQAMDDIVAWLETIAASGKLG